MRLYRIAQDIVAMKEKTKKTVWPTIGTSAERVFRMLHNLNELRACGRSKCNRKKKNSLPEDSVTGRNILIVRSTVGPVCAFRLSHAEMDLAGVCSFDGFTRLSSACHRYYGRRCRL